MGCVIKLIILILCDGTGELCYLRFLIVCYLADRCTAVITWLETNTLADKDEFEDKLKDLQKECSPIMTKLHQAGAKGPNVEEVD